MKNRRSQLMTLPRGLALTIAIILLASAAASTAHAGEYPVYACHPAAGNVNHSWVAQANHGGMTAYTTCPTSDSRTWNVGLVTRHGTVPSNPNATVPTGSWAGQLFLAPPGAGLARISYSQEWCGGGGFRSGIMNGGGTWLRYGYVGWCELIDQPHYTLNLGGTSAVRVLTQCVTGPCHVGGTALRAWATTRSVIVTVSDATRPRIALTGGSALSPGWIRGDVDLVVGGTDNVGIRSAEYHVGGRLLGTALNACTYTLRVPCPGLSRRLPVNTRAVADGRQPLTVTVRDAAGNKSSSTRYVYIDNTAPSPPLSVRVLGGSGWRNRNSYSVSWRNPNQTGIAPIRAVRTAICPAVNSPDAWSGCRHRTIQGAGIDTVKDLQVPHAGQWVVRVWLEDAAGNQDARTAQSALLRLDDSAPQVAFGPTDADDPGRIDVRASDSVSPLRRTEIEYRRRGDRSWTPLATSTTSSGFSARLDDEHLADGSYELRARAFDSAGNERSTDRLANGSLATRRVPIRVNTRLVAGQIKHLTARRAKGRKPRRRRVIVVRPTVRYGRTIPIEGRLTTPGGNPVANAAIEVWQRISVPAANWRRVAVIGTDGSGGFTFKALRGPSRALRFRYPGTRLVRARTSEVEIHVKATTTIRSSRTRVVNGDEVTFRGRVLGRPLPSTGKLLKLQAYSRGRWLTFATPRANALSGRWSYRYRFTATRGTVRYRFRAEVPTESGFPYKRGTSRSVRVAVRGL
jgi:hypothetical protein